MSLIIDLRNFARTNIQMILSKWNHFALGILGGKKSTEPGGEKGKEIKKKTITKQTKKVRQTKNSHSKKQRKKYNLFNSQMLSILCLFKSVRSVGSHCLLKVGPIWKGLCSYLLSYWIRIH